LSAEIQLELEVLENDQRIRQMFSEGVECYEEGLFEACIEKMMAVLSIDPSHERAVQFIKDATERKDSLES